MLFVKNAPNLPDDIVDPSKRNEDKELIVNALLILSIFSFGLYSSFAYILYRPSGEEFKHSTYQCLFYLNMIDLM